MAENDRQAMNVITLIDPQILGEEHPQYGFSVWSDTDQDMPVMFNTKSAVNLIPHVRITYEEAVPKTSAKGKEYLRLKKVKFEDDPVAKADVIPFTEKAAPTFNKSEPSKAFLKDLSDAPIRIYNGSLNYAKEAGLNLIGNSEDRREYLEYVQDVTNELLVWSDKIRSGSQGEGQSAPQATNEPKPQAAAASGPLRSAFEERKNLPKAVHWAEDEPPYSDQDIPEEM